MGRKKKYVTVKVATLQELIRDPCMTLGSNYEAMNIGAVFLAQRILNGLIH